MNKKIVRVYDVSDSPVKLFDYKDFWFWFTIEIEDDENEDSLIYNQVSDMTYDMGCANYSVHKNTMWNRLVTRIIDFRSMSRLT